MYHFRKHGRVGLEGFKALVRGLEGFGFASLIAP